MDLKETARLLSERGLKVEWLNALGLGRLVAWFVQRFWTTKERKLEWEIKALDYVSKRHDFEATHGFPFPGADAVFAALEGKSPEELPEPMRQTLENLLSWLTMMTHTYCRTAGRLIIELQDKEDMELEMYRLAWADLGLVSHVTLLDDLGWDAINQIPDVDSLREYVAHVAANPPDHWLSNFIEAYKNDGDISPQDAAELKRQLDELMEKVRAYHLPGVQPEGETPAS